MDRKDRDDFLSRLGDLIPGSRISCYAWALMNNHAHFLLRTGDSPLATFMLRLLTGYAGRFNRRHKRYGPLFQNRFKSIVCQEDTYLRELVRYIHLNPLRAGIVPNLRSLNTYRYCGNSAIMGKREFEWQETGYVLSYFGKRVTNARKSYYEYVKEGIGQGRRPELVGGGLIRSLGGWDVIKKSGLKSIGRVKGDDRILGDSEFVLKVLKEADEKFDRYYELKRLGYNLQSVEDRVCKIFDLSVKDISHSQWIVVYSSQINVSSVAFSSNRTPSHIVFPANPPNPHKTLQFSSYTVAIISAPQSPSENTYTNLS